MHCLYCHAKIPRLRALLSKSEFCCDEHAELHRKQTLDRLLLDNDYSKGSVPDLLQLSAKDPETPPFEPAVAAKTAPLAFREPFEETITPSASAPIQPEELEEPEYRAAFDTVDEFTFVPQPEPAEATVGLQELAENVKNEPALQKPQLVPGSGEVLAGHHDASLICFLPVQGGNGASTVALHVADALSHAEGKSVLLVDFDFHSGTLAFRLGLKPEFTLTDVVESRFQNEVLRRGVCRWNQLDILVAPPSTGSIDPEHLRRIPAMFAAALKIYPFVIVDHPDAIYSSSREVLTIADRVYLVCTPEITSLHLARRKAQQIRAMGVPAERLRLVVNRSGSWGSLTIKDVNKVVGIPVDFALDNDYGAVREAAWNGGLVKQDSALAQQLRDLGERIQGREQGVPQETTATASVPTTH